MRYRKIHTVTAEQFKGTTQQAEKFDIQVTDKRFSINTKQGVQEVFIGDYIITNPDGESYPCNEKTFLETYLPA